MPILVRGPSPSAGRLCKICKSHHAERYSTAAVSCLLWRTSSKASNCQQRTSAATPPPVAICACRVGSSVFLLCPFNTHHFSAPQLHSPAPALSNRPTRLRASACSRMDVIAWNRAPVVTGIDVSLQRHAAFSQVRRSLLNLLLLSWPCSQTLHRPMQNCENLIESLTEAAVDLARGGGADPQQARLRCDCLAFLVGEAEDSMRCGDIVAKSWHIRKGGTYVLRLSAAAPGKCCFLPAHPPGKASPSAGGAAARGGSTAAGGTATGEAAGGSTAGAEGQLCCGAGRHRL